MRHWLLATSIVAASFGIDVYACVSSGRTTGQFVGYDAVQLVPVNMPSHLQTAFTHAYQAWNSCNNSTTPKFPLFQTGSAGAARTVSVFFDPGYGPATCGTFAGNEIRLYGKVVLNGRTYSCTDSAAFQDTLSHELGHLIGLKDSACQGYIMGPRQMTSTTGTTQDRRVTTPECQKADEVNQTPKEQEQSLCNSSTANVVFGRVLAPLQNCDPTPCPNYECSPIVIDLEDDGFSLTGVEEPVAFDINADGALEIMGWTAPGAADGFLALDRNRNGVIDDGGELFGDSTLFLAGFPAQNGYQVLAELDIVQGNGNGWVDPEDSFFRSLRIWTDENHDGVSQRSEVRPLRALGIAALDTAFRVSFDVDEHGNWFRYRSTAIIVREGTRSATETADIYFVIAP